MSSVLWFILGWLLMQVCASLFPFVRAYLYNLPVLDFFLLIAFATFYGVKWVDDIPTWAFWVLFVMIIPLAGLLPLSIFTVILYTLVCACVKPHLPILPPSLLHGAFWVVFVLGLPALSYVHQIEGIPFQYVGFACWLALAVLMYDEIHFLMHVGYWISWCVLWVGLALAFRTESHFSWHVALISIGASLAACILPQQSLLRFMSWIVATFVGWVIFYQFYHWFFTYPETYLFPFNMISGYYKVSSPRWYPAWERPDSAAKELCETCKRLVSKSALIMGSRLPLVRLVEQHDTWDSFDDFQTFKDTKNPPCQMCHLLWNSVGELHRKKSALPVQVKVWEERPLSRYTFAQLHLDNTAIGTRLLIHRGKLFGQSSTASKCQSTESDLHVEQLASWIEDCEKHHKRCNEASNKPRELPTRLLHILPPATTGSSESSNDDPVIRIQTTESMKDDIKYVALSHRWGESVPFKLLNENYASCLNNIDFSGLSKNMRHAVLVARRLNFSYLWIDSLCIIQDSPSDWETEAAKMGDVYAGAFCTIAATGSPDGDGGCFQDRETVSFQPCEIGTSSREDIMPEWIYIRRDSLSDFRNSVDRAPLNTRGWVLQERLLSRRILHFGAEMIYWECSQRAASELDASGFVYKQYPEEFYGNYIPRPISVNPEEDIEFPPYSRDELIYRRFPGPDFAGFEQDKGRTVWQEQRAFWKEIRRASPSSWAVDSDEWGSLRFRTSLDKLGHPEYWSSSSSSEPGIFHFSNCWYEIVEVYTRCQLKYSKDKLVAVSGIIKRIQDVRNCHPIAGLWREHLVTDLLWFTSDGPGTRLLEYPPPEKKKKKETAASVKLISDSTDGKVAEQPIEEQETGKSQTGGMIRELPEEMLVDAGKRQATETISTEHQTEEEQQSREPNLEVLATATPTSPPRMAPSWSWASIDGAVTLDLLPENAKREITWTEIASVDDVAVHPVRWAEPDEYGKALAGTLKIRGPLLKVTKVHLDDGSNWYLSVQRPGRLSARLFPDLVMSEYDIKSENTDRLFCLSCLIVRREVEYSMLRRRLEEVQGLVLRLLEEGQNGAPDVFERVGFFSTARMGRSSPHKKRFKSAPVTLVHVV
ncbi:hypothetical protein AAE478_002532 [Parahypoxylon ruwenzoriense]